MAASYPGAIKSFSSVVNGVTKLVALLFNSAYDEVTAIETELGTDVAGSASDLKTRLAVSMNDSGTIKAPSTSMPAQIYDSGWFAVTTGTAYTKTHNLGTIKALVITYFSPDSDGGTFCIPVGHNSASTEASGVFQTVFSTTQVVVVTGSTYIYSGLSDVATAYNPTSGYLRILIIAL